MKKISALCVLILTLALLATACSSGSTSESGDESTNTEKKVLTAGTEGTMYPWTYTEDDEIVGFEADIIAEISERTGYDIEMQAIEWESLFGSLDSSRLDTVANIVTITEERSEKYYFTQPYVYNPMVLATKSDSDIESLDDIDGATIVCEVGSSDEQVCDTLEEELGVTLDRQYYDGISIKDVENGRVDLWIGGEPSLNAQIEEGYDLKVIGYTGQYQEYGYPFLKDDAGQELCEAFDEALTAMKEDGTLKEISEKWFSMDISVVPEE